MIVPWQGFELSKLINILEPRLDTKYVEFETFYRPKEANNQKQNWYPWPYKEIITIEKLCTLWHLLPQVFMNHS